MVYKVVNLRGRVYFANGRRYSVLGVWYREGMRLHIYLSSIHDELGESKNITQKADRQNYSTSRGLRVPYNRRGNA